MSGGDSSAVALAVAAHREAVAELDRAARETDWRRSRYTPATVLAPLQRAVTQAEAECRRPRGSTEAACGRGVNATVRAYRLDRYVPAWLPPDQHAAFVARLAAAFERYEAAHGWRALSDTLTRGRLVGGVASAFKAGRLDPAWGRRMLARCAVRARLRQIAEAGYQRRAYFEDLGRRAPSAAGEIPATERS